ncbi:MAG: hypothetical protein Aurels2KO_03460 [Aureliella sp.]
MKILSISSKKTSGHESREQGLASFVPTSEILNRVRKIKEGWDPETARARAAEGERRRHQLESLIGELLVEAEMAETECADPDFTVVC